MDNAAFAASYVQHEIEKWTDLLRSSPEQP